MIRGMSKGGAVGRGIAWGFMNGGATVPVFTIGGATLFAATDLSGCRDCDPGAVGRDGARVTVC